MRAWVFAGFAIAAAAVGVALAIAGHDARATFDGAVLTTTAAFAVVGLVVVRRQPNNRIGRLLLAASVFFGLNGLGTGYLVLDYFRHSGDLPFARVAFGIETAWVPAMVCLGSAVLLFPNGTPPSLRWRRPLIAYYVVGIWFSTAFIAAQAGVRLGPQVRIDSSGNYAGDGGGFSDAIGGAAWLTAPIVIGFWIAFVAQQARAWRRAHGERREQVKWLMCGGALSVISIVVLVYFNTRYLRDLSALGISALPIGIGVGILKYRLYEIDRLISRTLSYAIVTGTLVAVFVGLVSLTTGVLPFSSPVGVAASTLVAAALFTPLRRRVQHIVDRRFNRVRYDADAILTGFSGRLRETVDLATIESDLLAALNLSLAPGFAAVWIKPPA